MDHRRPKLLPERDSLSPMPPPPSPRFGQDDPGGGSRAEEAPGGGGAESAGSAIPAYAVMLGGGVKDGQRGGDIMLI